MESFFASPQPSVSFIIQDGGISDYSSLAQQTTPALQAIRTFLRSPQVSRVEKAKNASNLRKAPRKRLLHRLLVVM